MIFFALRHTHAGKLQHEFNELILWLRRDNLYLPYSFLHTQRKKSKKIIDQKSDFDFLWHLSRYLWYNVVECKSLSIESKVAGGYKAIFFSNRRRVVKSRKF